MAIRGEDGSIILTTKVNTDGIKKGLGTTESAVSKTTQKIERLGKVVERALESGDAKAAQLANRYKKATEEVEKQTAKVEELKNKLSQLESGELKIEDKDILQLQNELNKTSELIKKLDAEADSLYARSGTLQAGAFRAPGTNEPVLTPSEQAELDKINARLDEIEPKLESSRKKALELGDALKTAMGKTTQNEIEKTTQELDSAEKKLADLTTKAEITRTRFEKGTNSTRQATKRVGNAFDSAGKRLWRLAKSALIFSTITKAFTVLRENIGAALLSNEDFRRSVQQLQAAIWTVSEPLYQAVLPALQTLVKWLTKGIMYVATFFGALQGKTIQQTLQSAKALNKEAEAMKNLSEESKKARKQLASFDDLSILSKNAVDTPLLDVQAGFDDLEDLLNDSDMENLIKFQDWVINNKEAITNALEIAGVVGLAAGIGSLIFKIGDLLKIFKKKDSALDTQTNKTRLEAETVGELVGAFLLAAVAAGVLLPGLNKLTKAGLETIPSANGAREALANMSPAIDGVSESAVSLSPALEGANESIDNFTLSSESKFGSWYKNIKAYIDGVVDSIFDLQTTADKVDLTPGFTPQKASSPNVTPQEKMAEIFDRFIVKTEESAEATSEQVTETESATEATKVLIGKFEFAADAADMVALDTLLWSETLSRMWENLNKFFQALADNSEPVGGFGMPAFSYSPLPMYAKGVVLPGGKPYMAIVNDQPAGQTNVEAPLQTIVDAFNISLAQNGGAGSGKNIEVVLELDRRELGRAVVEVGNEETRRVGPRLVIA